MFVIKTTKKCYRTFELTSNSSFKYHDEGYDINLPRDYIVLRIWSNVNYITFKKAFNKNILNFLKKQRY